MKQQDIKIRQQAAFAEANYGRVTTKSKFCLSCDIIEVRRNRYKNCLTEVAKSTGSMVISKGCTVNALYWTKMASRKAKKKAHKKF